MSVRAPNNNEWKLSTTTRAKSVRRVVELRPVSAFCRRNAACGSRARRKRQRAASGEENGVACAIHADGDEHCPFFFNGARDSAIASSREAFDARCCAHVKKYLPKSFRGFTGAAVFKALEQLLAAF